MGTKGWDGFWMRRRNDTIKTMNSLTWKKAEIHAKRSRKYIKNKEVNEQLIKLQCSTIVWFGFNFQIP